MIPKPRREQFHSFVLISLWYNFCLAFKEGDMGEPEHRNAAKKKKKKIDEHRITARKIDETPSPQQLFLAI